MRMSNNPIDWQIAQLQTVAKEYGISWRHDGGSHCVFITAKWHIRYLFQRIVLIKPIYVKKFVALVKETQDA